MMNRAQAQFFWISAALTAVPGAILFYMKYLLKPTDPYSVVNHPWQPHALHAHVLMAPLLMYALGLITLNHVSPRYESGIPEGRRSGISMALLFWPMAASGYLLQVTTSPGFHKMMAWVHLVTSFLFVLLLAGHYWNARAYRAR